MAKYPPAVYAGIVFSLSLAACALYWDSSRVVLAEGSEWTTVAGMNQEYRDAIRRLTLPEGRSWPKELPYEGEDEEGTPYTYAAGIGEEWAEWYWFDAWAAASVAETASAASRQEAIARLPEFYETEAYSTSADRDYFRNMIQKASAGDIGPLSEYTRTMPDRTGTQEEAETP